MSTIMGSKTKIIEPAISIVIPARNEEGHIGDTLRAIFNQEIADRFEVIVIDSGSQDRTIQVVKGFPTVRLVEIKPSEFGHGKTRNLAMNLAQGQYVVLVNADALPVNNRWLHFLVDGLKGDPQVAGVYSRHLPRQDCPLYMVRDLWCTMNCKRLEKTGVSRFDSMIFSTVSAALRKTAWEKIPFDDSIDIAEDQAWARQVIAGGYKIIYEPESLVFHSHTYTLGQLYRSKYRIGRATGRFKNRFSALFLGFILVLGGTLFKVTGDLIFILLRNPWSLPLGKRLKEFCLAVAARAVGFWARYRGWLSRR